MEEIEDFYKQESEKIENSFLQDSQKGADRKILEQKYRQEIKKLIQEYQKRYSKALANSKKNHFKLPESKKEKFKRLNVEEINIKISWKEKKILNFKIWKYKTKRKLRNMFFKITPVSFIYNYFKLKRYKKNFYSKIDLIYTKISNYLAKKIENTKEVILRLAGAVSNSMKKITSFIKEKIFRIKAKKQDKKDSEKENSEENEKKDSEKEEQQTKKIQS